MRHNKHHASLGVSVEHRRAMLSNMAASLILHKRITTTLAKAKALRGYVEPIITKSKIDSTHSRRLVFSHLQNKEAVTELFREVSIKVADRPGGYTRIIKTGNRLGDNAEMCLIELVDFNENLLKEKAADKKGAARTTRRGRRGAGTAKAGETTPQAEAKVKPAIAAAPAVVAAPEAVVEDAAIPEATAPEIVADEETKEE